LLCGANRIPSIHLIESREHPHPMKLQSEPFVNDRRQARAFAGNSADLAERIRVQRHGDFHNAHLPIILP
jgi:hypothetical protein